MDTKRLLLTAFLAIWQVESGQSLTPNAGDNGKAVGPLQIWKIRVVDVNRISKERKLGLCYSYSDRKDLSKSVQMFAISCLHYWPVDEHLTSNQQIERWARHWNGSPTTGPFDSGTIGYWEKCKKVMENDKKPSVAKD